MIFENLPDNVNITVSKNDLIDLLSSCLLKGKNLHTLHFSAHLTIKRLSEYGDFSKPANYKMVGQSEIPYDKRSGKLLFKRSEIGNWILDFKHPRIKNRIEELN